MMPVIAQKSPYPVEMTAGQTVYWCSCGKSSRQPLCDGSHKDTGLIPMPFTAEKDGTVYFCGCKTQRRRRPVTERMHRCDLTHDHSADTDAPAADNWPYAGAPQYTET